MANKLLVLLRKVAAFFAPRRCRSPATAVIVTLFFHDRFLVLHYTVAGHPVILDWIASFVADSGFAQVGGFRHFLTALALSMATQIKLSIDVTNHQRNPDSDQKTKALLSIRVPQNFTIDAKPQW